MAKDNMTLPVNTDQVQEPKTDTSEVNLAKQRKHYERQLEQERLARQQAEERATSAERAAQERTRSAHVQEEDDDSEPYVDKRKLKSTLANFEKNIDEKIDKKAEEKARFMIAQERESSYLQKNPDFNRIMADEDLLNKFSQKFPDEAESILEMPPSFARQKLVYASIKSRGLDKPEVKAPPIQEKVDANRRAPFYQPNGVGAAPYSSQGDFSQAGQKQAFAKMQELKSRLRLG